MEILVPSIKKKKKKKPLGPTVILRVNSNLGPETGRMKHV